MGALNIWKILILVAIIVLLFGGRGKITNVMGDFARGIKSFKSGLKDDDDAPKVADDGRTIDGTATREKTEV